MQQDSTRRVLVTGVAGTLATQLAARLEQDDRVAYVAGVDIDEPETPLARTEFVRADLRNPVVARILRSARIDTIAHLAMTATPRRAGGRSRMKELNVIGSMQLFAAAQHAAHVQRVVLKSTTAVYGSSHSAPSLLREDAELDTGPVHGYTKDALEVEGYARDLARRRPDAAMTVLRFANLLGPNVQSPLTRYLRLPAVPTALGYDPRLQVCHERDAVEILTRSVLGERPGIFNVAGPGVVYLSQAIRIVGKPAAPVPLPLLTVAFDALRRAAPVDVSPEQLHFLRHGRVADITRMRESFAYEPAFDTRAALEDFVASGGVEGWLTPEVAARWERRVLRLARAGSHGVRP